MPSLPSSLALSGWPIDGSAMVAAPGRTDLAAVQTAVNGTITALTGGTAGDVLGGVGTTLTYAKPPGYELGRTAVVAGTTAISTGTEVAPIDFASLTVTCDGTAVDVLSAGVIQWASGFANGDVLAVSLWLDGVDQGRVFYDQAEQAAVGITRATPFTPVRLTPTSGSRVFKLRGWCTPAGVKNLISGAGGAGAQSPAFIRVVKV